MPKILAANVVAYANRVIVAGSRLRMTDDFFKNRIEQVLYLRGYTDNLEDVVFISGVAKLGGDRNIVDYCIEESLDYAEYPANWDNLNLEPRLIRTNRFGKQYNAMAGFARNQQMAEVGTELVVFWDMKSNGTQDMMNRAYRRGFTITLVDISDMNNVHIVPNYQDIMKENHESEKKES